MAGEKEAAAQFAERERKVVGDKAVPDDYWKTATVAEVQLLQGNVEAAARLYAAAEVVVIAPLDYGSHQSTLGQTNLLLSALGATGEQMALIAAVFPSARGRGE